MPYTAEYPATIPDATDIYEKTADVDFVFPADFDGLRQELKAVMDTLGVNPQGEYDDVVARLDAGGGGNKAIIRVRYTGNLSVSSETITKVDLDNVFYDINSDFDATTNYRFDVPANGIYDIHVKGTLLGSSQGTAFSLYIYVNGSNKSNSYQANGASATFTAEHSAQLQLEAGDYVDLRVRHNDSGSKDVGGLFMEVNQIS